MKVTRDSILLDPFTLEDAAVVDIRFDGHRVWSASVPYAEDGEIRLRWPKALRKRLTGRTTVTLTDSATQRLIDTAEVRFGRAHGRLELIDARGRWLAMTKWDRLGPVLEGRDASVGAELLRNGRRLVDDLQSAGHDVYIVGGTLLGIVRDGGLLPHDDDLDLAFYCRAENAIDLGLESYKMERILQERGYTVIRHSLAHLEIEYFNEAGEPDHYIDIFTGFFRDGLYCQPFALRGDEVKPEDLVPTQPRVIDGVTLPEPAIPEAWLSYAYGEGWRVPDPTFKFVTPKSTLRRFEGWFGVFNRGRVYWDKHYLEYEEPIGFAPAGRPMRRFLEDIPEGARILDLGCGDGRWATELARSGHRVTAVDYSHEALRIARAGDSAGAVDFRYLNINDRAALFELGTWMLGTGDEWCIFAHHTTQSLTKVNRQNLLLFLDLVLRGGGFADLVNDETFSNAYEHGRPSTWHLPYEWLVDESEGHPLDLRLIDRWKRRDGRQRRSVGTVRVQRADGRITAGDEVFTRARRERTRRDAIIKE